MNTQPKDKLGNILSVGDESVREEVDLSVAITTCGAMVTRIEGGKIFFKTNIGDSEGEYGYSFDEFPVQTKWIKVAFSWSLRRYIACSPDDSVTQEMVDNFVAEHSNG